MPRKFVIPHFRWWVAGLLFLMSVINYIDRQALSALSVYIKEEFNWSNADYARVLNAFTISYTIMQAVCGRLLDIVGTQRGLAISVAFYSAVSAMTALSRGVMGFSACRFLLGAGEAANNPGGSKTISEWFPARERAIAVAVFNCGCALGGALAPFLVVWLYNHFQSWRPAFVVVALLGFVWAGLWLLMYRRPETHPWVSDKERAYILANRTSGAQTANEGPKVRWTHLFRYKQTWGMILGRFLIDPFWYFVVGWYALYFKSKGFSNADSAYASGVLIATVFGNFFGGILSGALVRRGWPVGRARRAVLGICGPSILALSLALYSSNYWVLIALLAWCSFAYGACSTIHLTLPTDVFHTRAVGAVMGLAGTGAGIGTLLTTWLIGLVTNQAPGAAPDPALFTPVIIGASVLPTLATIAFLTLVRASKKDDPEGVLLKF